MDEPLEEWTFPSCTRETIYYVDTGREIVTTTCKLNLALGALGVRHIRDTTPDELEAALAELEESLESQ